VPNLAPKLAFDFAYKGFLALFPCVYLVLSICLCFQ
jgi:hypothetical protein